MIGALIVAGLWQEKIENHRNAMSHDGKESEIA